MPTGRRARPIVVTTGHAAESNMIGKKKASCFLKPARCITTKKNKTKKTTTQNDHEGTKSTLQKGETEIQRIVGAPVKCCGEHRHSAAVG